MATAQVKENFSEIALSVNAVSDHQTKVARVKGGAIDEATGKRRLFKSVVVNARAKKRHSGGGSDAGGHKYGLPPNYAALYPSIAREMDDFMTYMTQPSAASQDSPIRETTATVYLRHAKLFLGWYLKEKAATDSPRITSVAGAGANDSDDDNSAGISNSRGELSIYNIFETKEAAAAQPIVDFVLWLRRTRDISDSYEANMLRGLTKLLKCELLW